MHKKMRATLQEVTGGGEKIDYEQMTVQAGKWHTCTMQKEPRNAVKSSCCFPLSSAENLDAPTQTSCLGPIYSL